MLRHLLLCLTLSISGCASWPVTPPPADASVTSTRSLSHWQASGKASLRLSQQTHNLSFAWQRQQQDFTASLSGPFGQGRTELSLHDGLLTLNNDTIGTLTSTKPDLLLALVAGTPMPITHLNAWLMGWPALPETAIEDVASEHRGTRQFRENGWQIRVEQTQFLDGYVVPRKVVLEQAPHRLIFVITDWAAKP